MSSAAGFTVKKRFINTHDVVNMQCACNYMNRFNLLK